MKGVPPHLAIRRAERTRVTNYIKNHPGVRREDVPPRQRNSSQDYLIVIGARQIAIEVLVGPSFEHAKNPQGVKVCRLRPDPPQPLPAGWTRWQREPKRKWADLTPEEQREKRREIARKATLESMKRRGIEITDDYETVSQRKERLRREWEAMTPEEQAKWRSERSKKAARTRLINMGIDPDTHVTQDEKRARAKAERERITEEERYRKASETSKKGWATRKARKETDG